LGSIGNGGGSMSNCYVTGTVTGVSNVGGLVGSGASTNFNNPISHSVALNTIVKATNGPAGRISAINTGPRTNNAALATMSADGGAAFSGENTADGLGGADITPEEILGGDGTIGGRFTAANGWTVEAGKLPVLFASKVGISNTPDKKQLQVIHTSSGIEIQLAETSVIELYNASGQLIEKTTASGVYSRNLERGMYIVRVNGQAVKFVR